MKNLILIIFLLTAFVESRGQQGGRDYALFFFATDFTDIRWQKLPEAEKEVQALAQELKTNYGFSTEVVTATDRNVVVSKIKAYNKKLKPADRLVVFFSTQGFYQKNTDRAYLVPQKGKAADPTGASYLSYEDAGALLTACAGKQVLLLMDACYSGGFGVKDSGKVQIAQDCRQKLAEAGQARGRLFTACGGMGARTAGASPLVAKLLEALRANTDVLNWRDLGGYLNMSNCVRGSFNGRESGGDFVFVRKGSCPPVEPEKGKVLVTELGFQADDFVTIQGDTFQVGSDEEGKKFMVILSSFSICKFEIKVAQFKQFVEDSGYKTDAEKEDRAYAWTGTEWRKKAGVNWRHDEKGHLRRADELNYPVIHISWNDAMAYCDWLTRRTGQTYRLPTEAQWEYAAGNGKKHSQYSWGNETTADKISGNLADETVKKLCSTIFKDYTDNFTFTAPVGSFRPNDFGLYDMTGNVWEWCSDWYAAAIPAKPWSLDPFGSDTGAYRAVKGGSWYSSPLFSRTAVRNYYMPDVRYFDLGFRVVRMP